MTNKVIILSALITLIMISACVAENAGDKIVENNEKQIAWYTNLEEAQVVAQENNLPIFIHFTGSDWCGWCFKLEGEVYSKAIFQEYVAENWVMVKIDFPKKIKQTAETVAYNRELSTRFGIRGFPTVQMLESDGTPIGQTGYQKGGAELYIDHLKDFLIKK